MRIEMAARRGDMREALGWNFVKRLEKLVDDLLGKIDCPQEFWVVYTAKWDSVNRKIREFWQVTDKKPCNMQLGQCIYYVNKAGHADFVALPYDIPVPESELSDEMVTDNYHISKNIPLSNQEFEKIYNS